MCFGMGTCRPNVVFLARSLPASSRNHGEDYGDEKVKNATGLISKTKTLNLQQGFLTDFFTVITRLTLSNVIGVATRRSSLSSLRSSFD